MQHGERRALSCSVIQAVIGAGELGLRPVFPSVLLPCLSSTQIQEEMHSCGIFLKSAFSWVTGAAE